MTLYLTSSIEFINSIADAKALAIFDDNKRLLTAPPLDMKDSEAAIRAVVTCVRDHPPRAPPLQTRRPLQKQQARFPELLSSSRPIFW